MYVMLECEPFVCLLRDAVESNKDNAKKVITETRRLSNCANLGAGILAT